MTYSRTLLRHLPPSASLRIANMISARVAPSNLQTEQMLLGALLNAKHQACYAELKPILRAEHFADPLHGAIFASIANRLDAGEPADAHVIENAYAEMSILDEVGGTAYLHQLVHAQPDLPPDIVSLAQGVACSYLHRVIIDTCETIGTIVDRVTKRAFDRDKDLQDPDLTKTLHLRLSAALHLLDFTELGLNLDDVQVVGGHVVDMRHPDHVAMQTDIYGEPMLITTALDREEVLVLSEFHHEAKRRAIVLRRTGESDHHGGRGALFADALLDLDPMEPPKPWEHG